MRSESIISVIVFCSILIAGCIQLPGMHILSNTPDPIIGQWIGGELTASDRHIIFYETRHFFNEFLFKPGENDLYRQLDKKEPGLYSMQSVTGEINDWVYDSFEDSMYMSGIPR
jgi:hypothetical protein